MTDAGLIEQAKIAASHGYVGSPGPLLAAMADRLAELTKPTPWRSVSEPPEPFVDVWVRRVDAGVTKVELGYVTGVGAWMTVRSDRWIAEATGWQPIVRPEP